MSPTEVLHEADTKALDYNQVILHVTSKTKANFKGKAKALGATGFITILLVVIAVFFSSGFLIPAAISERLIEATDVQHADAVESQIVVFSQSLLASNLDANEIAIPNNTVQRLKDNGVLVGYEENGEFIEYNKGGRDLSLFYNGQVIAAKDFFAKVNSDAGLYNAFNTATYSRAAYYYDDTAREVFKRIGTSRNNFTADSNFEEVASNIMGEGSNIDVNNVTLVSYETENGETEYTYEEVGVDASSKTTAADFINSVAQKNQAENSKKATFNSADALTVADTISKEQRSSLFFLAFMENISKMKAGDGNEAKINEAMNTLYQTEKSEVVDVNTGEVITVEGSMMESPSLYAILAGERVDTSKVENYSSERILKTVENLSEAKVENDTLSGTITSTNSKVRGSIGRFLNGGSARAEDRILASVTPTIESSLMDNSFSTIKGVTGGEMLVEGAVNVGKMLAQASGGSVGDAASIKSYARVSSQVLALEAEADRMNRSPFDITSRNTFLGSLVYKLAFSTGGIKTGLLSGLTDFSQIAKNSAASLAPSGYADDENYSYLTNYGDCERLQNIGAEGSVTCSAIITFDTSTLEDIFNDPEFINFMEKNTTLENGVRKINENSTLADYIKYNNERITPIGVTDGGILASLKGGNGKIPFISDIVAMIKNFLGASEEEKKIASGEAFVNSATNNNWNTYKYAQRYVALARATAVLRQYDGEETAYSNLKYFEGIENPVVAFLNDYYATIYH